jgi:hypothetical protein
MAPNTISTSNGRETASSTAAVPLRLVAMAPVLSILLNGPRMLFTAECFQTNDFTVFAGRIGSKNAAHKISLPQPRGRTRHCIRLVERIPILPNIWN